VLVAAIFFFVFWYAAPLLPKIDWFGNDGFFTSTNWHAKEREGATYGVLAMIVGNFAVAAVAMIIAIPLGLAAAVYISEFAGPRAKEWFKVSIEILAAIPSIVWGFIAITMIGPLLIKYAGATMGANLLNGGIVLGLMSVPLIVSLAEDSLRAVPDSFREAAMALGANRWEIVYRVLFPAARSGLMAACMLGVGRAIGETMAVLLATGNKNQIPTSFTDPITTLTATIASEMGDAEAGSPHSQSLLLVITCAINLTANLFIRGNKRKSAA
jgi:phosphate transport system permease protein